MTYNQYTNCVKASDHSKMNQYVQVFLKSGIVGVAIAAVLIAAGEPLCALIGGLPIFLASSQLAYCSWWLNDRLICLPNLDTDKYAVGLLVSVQPPSKKTGFDAYDSDYSINLLPAYAPIGATQAQIEGSKPFGYLVSQQDATRNEGLPWTGETAHDEVIGKDCAVLHAEFEGASVRDAADGAGVALVLALAALIVCVAVPPPWGIVIGIILALLAFLAQILGALLGKSDYGSPSDVDPSLGALHPRDMTGTVFDLLGVSGTWVYDAGHNNENKGWNEIHPIKACHRVGQWDGKGDWPKDLIDGDIAKFPEALQAAGSPATVAAQRDPSSRWHIHPMIDGCRPRRENSPAIS